jgi:hypothetical protein
MTTKNPRLNVTLDAEQIDQLAAYAEREDKSLSSAARDLITLALDLFEDRNFSHAADKREDLTSRWIAHDDAW